MIPTEWKLPENKTPEDARRHLAEASRLLNEAGYTIKNGVRTNAKGERLEFEMLLDSEDFQRIVQPFGLPHTGPEVFQDCRRGLRALAASKLPTDRLRPMSISLLV